MLIKLLGFGILFLLILGNVEVESSSQNMEWNDHLRKVRTHREPRIIRSVEDIDYKSSLEDIGLEFDELSQQLIALRQMISQLRNETFDAVKEVKLDTRNEMNELKLELSTLSDDLLKSNEEIKNGRIAQKKINNETLNKINEVNSTLSAEVSKFNVEIKNTHEIQNQTKNETLGALNELNFEISILSDELLKTNEEIKKSQIAQNQVNKGTLHAVDEVNSTLSAEVWKSNMEIKNTQKAQNQLHNETQKAVNEIRHKVSNLSAKLSKSNAEIKQVQIVQNQLRKRYLLENSKIPPPNTTEMTTIVQILKTIPDKNCKRLFYQGHTRNGVYQIQPDTSQTTPIQVYCSMQEDGGGWTIIQRRGMRLIPKAKRLSFNRNWIEYQNGFGSANQDYWIGLRHMHSLTRFCENELKITLTSWNGTKYDAWYSNFQVSSVTDDYRLTIGSYNGGTLFHDGNELELNNKMKFTTYDRDTDKWDSQNCAAVENMGGWWYNNCGYVGLNSEYAEDGTGGSGTGIYWWPHDQHSWMKSEMKIRSKC